MCNLCGMVIWRPTVRLAAKLRLQLAETALRSDTRLGDWYAADLTLGRCRLVLCVSALSRLGVVLPAAPYATLPERLGPAVGRLLLHLGEDARAVEQEMGAMGTIAVAKTCSRSVLGTIKEFSWMLQLRHEAEPVTPELDPLLLGVELSGTVCMPLEDTFPRDAALRLLSASNGPVTGRRSDGSPV